MARRRVSAADPVVTGHAANERRAYPSYSLASNVAPLAAPSPAMTTPEQNASFVGQGGSDGSYAAGLAGELPTKEPPGRGLRLASFFCGCGGLDLGFRSAGFELAFATDVYPRACETYERNLGHAPLCEDVREVDCAAEVPSDVDVLAGGFPCVTFSMAGKRAGVEDGVNGMLYLELCRAIREVRPRYFVAENVKGMLSANNGRAVRLVLAEFLRLGYRVEHRLVNMAKYGVPQTRERVIFFGQRLDQVRGSFGFPRKTRRLVGDKKAPGWLPTARTLREAIGDLPEPAIERQLDTNPKSTSTRRAGDPAFSVRASGSTRCEVIADHDKVSGAVETSFGVAERGGNHEAPSPVVAAAAGSGVPWKDRGLRRMTVRECARVQSFPDWFEFAGSMSDGYRQVGNAVPPLYARRLAEAILEHDERRVVG